MVPGFGADGDGNLDPATDVRFRDPLSPSLAPTASGDYRLLDDSPLIEAGRAEADLGEDALDHIPRRLDWDLDGQLIPDIGAYESTRPAIIDEVIYNPGARELRLVIRSVGAGRYEVEYSRSPGAGGWSQVASGTLRPGVRELVIPGWRFGAPREQAFFRVLTP